VIFIISTGEMNEELLAWYFMVSDEFLWSKLPNWE